MERQPVKLTDMIEDYDAFEVANHLTAAEQYHLYSELGICEVDVINTRAEMAGTGSLTVMAAQVLKIWRSQNGRDATRQALLDALERCDNIEVKEDLEDYWNGRATSDVQKTPETDYFRVIDSLRLEAIPRLYEALGLTTIEIERAEASEGNNDKYFKARAVVRKWRRKNGKKATLEELKEAAQNCRHTLLSDLLAFDDLQFHKILGHGAHATVNAATFKSGYFRDPVSQRTFTEVAVKNLHRQEEKEVQIMKSLRHPHIVSFLAYLNNGPSYYIVMEKCQQSLYEYLQDPHKPLKDELRKRWVQEALEAVNYLHENHVVHRDLRSKNSLLTEDKLLKIADFGIAKIAGETTPTTKGHGTRPFIAPEVEVVKDKTFSAASDIFSLGFLFWEIYTREVPDPDKSGDPDQYIEERHKIPEHMQDLMRACWQLDPKKRPRFQLILTQLTSDKLQALTESQDSASSGQSLHVVRVDDAKDQVEPLEGVISPLMYHPQKYKEDFLEGIVLCGEEESNFKDADIKEFVMDQKWSKESTSCFEQAIQELQAGPDGAHSLLNVLKAWAVTTQEIFSRNRNYSKLDERRCIWKMMLFLRRIRPSIHQKIMVEKIFPGGVLGANPDLASKRVNDLPFGCHSKLRKGLELKLESGNDWRSIASKIPSVTQKEVDLWKQKGHETASENTLNAYSCRERGTVQHLYEDLIDIDRCDVALELELELEE